MVVGATVPAAGVHVRVFLRIPCWLLVIRGRSSWFEMSPATAMQVSCAGKSATKAETATEVEAMTLSARVDFSSNDLELHVEALVLEGKLGPVETSCW